jgi:hypothetical protein
MRIELPEKPRQKSWVEDGAVRIKAPTEADHEEAPARGSTGASVITERWLSTADHQMLIK